MKKLAPLGDRLLLRRFYLTEFFANIVGAPLAAAYGGFMIDFSRVSVGEFLLKVAAIMGLNQILLALPLNLHFGRKTRRGLRAWREAGLDAGGQTRFFNYLSILPLLQASLIFGRMLLSAALALFLVRGEFNSFEHLAAAFIFGLYASFVTGLFIYYYLHRVCSAVAEELASAPEAGHLAGSAGMRTQLSRILATLPPIVLTALASLGVFLLVLVKSSGSGNEGRFGVRIAAALILNLITSSMVLAYGQHFHRRRLLAVQQALDDILERGDISRRLASDLGDDYAAVAHRINKSFDLFRLLLAETDTASRKLSGTVASFSAQVRETVAATTQQASAVKEVLSTMEESNRINREISDSALALSDNARSSQDSVDEGFGKVQDTIHKMDEIKSANARTLREIDGLTEEISSIGEIIDIINSIANQTRIIAFNAELEASSAGQAGTSFRIVAEEIRRLANGTVDSLVGVKDRIALIQQGSARLQDSSEEGTAKIEEGLRLSGDLNDIFMRIRAQAEGTAAASSDIGAVLQEQGQAFDQIFMTLKQISEGAEQVLTSARINGSEVGKLQSLVEELQKLLARFERGSPAATTVLAASATSAAPANGKDVS